MKYYVYMLENTKGRHYIGIAINPEKRLLEHNNRRVKSTRGFGPWEIIYTEEFENRSEASKREYFLKHERGKKEKADIIQKYSFIYK